MRDAQFEDRLRQALRTEADALPFSITADDLRVRLDERRGTRATRMSLLSAAAAVVVVIGVGAAILIDRGNAPVVGSSQSPSPVATPTPRPSDTPPPGASLESYQALEDAITVAEGAAPEYLLHTEHIADPEAAEETATWDLGTVTSEGGYLNVVFDCEGPGPFAIAWKDSTGSVVAASMSIDGCDGPAEGYTASDVPPDALLELQTSERTSWRLIAYQVRVDGPVRPVLPELDDYDKLAEHRTEGRDATDTRVVAFPDGTDSVILQAACAGQGSVTVSDGTLTRVVDCTPSGTTAVHWDTVPAAAGEITLTIEHAGAVVSLVAVHAYDLEAHPGVKFVPPVATLSWGEQTAVSATSCGLGFTLANGEMAADSCGPGWPVIPLDRAIRVAAGTDLTMAVPRWRMTSVRAEVIATDDLMTRPHEEATWVPLADMDGGSDSVSFSAPITPGDWTIMLHTGAEKAGDTFSVPYLFRVIAQP